MSTTFYAATPIPCPHCGEPCDTKKLVIGNSSFGWQFVFRAYGHNPWDEFSIRSISELITYIMVNGSTIVNEYGNEIDLAEFLRMVDAKKDAKEPEQLKWFKDVRGYIFTTDAIE